MKTITREMESATTSLRDLKELLAELRQLVTHRPGPALLVAAALGFVIARSLASR